MIKQAFDSLRTQGFIARPSWTPEGDVSTLLVTRAAELRDKGCLVKGAVFFTREDVTNRSGNGAYPIHFGSVPTPKGKPCGLDSTTAGKTVLKSLQAHGVWCEWSGDPNEPIIVKEN